MMARIAVALFLVVLVLFMAMIVPPAGASHDTTPGFDQYGYNYKAKVFIGPADGVDRNLDGTVWGGSTYASDHLVMKWGKAWNNARFHGDPWTKEAWVDNAWNGKVPGGSGETWHYKIQWIGTCTDGTYFADGGYYIGGQFEVIMDQGVSDTNYCSPNKGGHQICGLAILTGLARKVFEHTGTGADKAQRGPNRAGLERLNWPAVTGSPWVSSQRNRDF